MKKLSYFSSVVLFAVVLTSAPVSAAPLDLSSWSGMDWRFRNGPNQSPSEWELQPGNTAVEQVRNANPSAYLNGIDRTNYTMNGSWRVNESGGDDDLMGFVFGYQDAGHFYLLDWKQKSQEYVGFAEEGLTVKKMGALDPLAFTWQDFWSSSDTDHKTILDSNLGAGKGWKDNITYDFSLDFRPGVFRIRVSEDGEILWETTVTDAGYDSGQFGFYNFSQPKVFYNGFSETIIEDPEDPPASSPVPEPSTVLLLAAGVIGIAGLRRKMAA